MVWVWFIPAFECAEQGIPNVVLDAILEKVYLFLWFPTS